MRNVSNAFCQAIKRGGPFYAYARINLQSGDILSLTSERDFFISGNKYDQSFTGAFPMGEAVCKTIDIGINNTDDRYSVHDFDGAVISLQTEVDVNNAVERLSEGVFTVLKAHASGDIIEISATDNMHKTDCDLPQIAYPTTLQHIVNRICTHCGITLATTNFNNRAFTVVAKPKDMKCREMLGYIAQIAGGNAMIDYSGKLIFRSYTPGQFSSTDIISGGTFGDDLTDIISGGTFGDDLTDIIQSPQANINPNYILLSNSQTDPTIAIDDITITGVTTTYKLGKTTQTETYGTDGYLLKINNPLISGQTSNGLRLIGDSIIGITFRPFSGTFSPNPSVELMDNVYVVDRKGNIYNSFITSNTFNYLGTSELSNDVKSAEENKASYTSNASQMYRQVQEDIDVVNTSWENAVDQLEQDLENASGLFETTQPDPNNPGSYIYYFHDKSTLAESTYVIKVTAQAIGISTDGGQTFPTGVTATGQAVLSEIYAIGLNADYITSGTLTVGGQNNVSGTIAVYDDSDALCGVVDKDGFNLYEGVTLKISGTQTPTPDSIEIAPSQINLVNSTNTKYIKNTTDKLTIQNGATTQVQIEPNIVNVYSKLSCSSMDITGDIKISTNSLRIRDGSSNVATFSGTIPIITSITANSQGRITWTGGSIKVVHGLITGYTSS